jgi:hypothetical protein
MPRWTTLLRRCDRPKPRTPTPGQREASAALGRAEDARDQVRAQRDEVAEEAHRWRRRREENHFAELIRTAVLGGESR